jgi:hypothetical protein
MICPICQERTLEEYNSGKLNTLYVCPGCKKTETLPTDLNQFLQAAVPAAVLLTTTIAIWELVKEEHLGDLIADAATTVADLFIG